MVALTTMRSDAQVIMLKTKIALNEIPIKSSSQMIWPFLVHQKDDDDAEELSMHRTSFSRVRLPDSRNYPIDARVSESFHCAMAPILSVAQIFGVFPISGVRSSSPTKLHFKRFSFLTVYSTVIVIMTLFVTIISVAYMVKSLNAETFQTRGGITGATVGAVFYGNSLLGAILFFRLSSRWMSFQCEWRAMEQYIDSNCADGPRLRWKLFLISAVVVLLALVEHVLSVINNMEGYEWSESTNSTFRNFLRVYSLNSHAFIFDILDYNLVFGLYIFVISKVATFTWNFTDIFIILISTGLAERYKSLNKKLASTVTKNRSRFDWRELREDYAILSSIVKKVDDQISPIIFLSFANNLYFICLQLLNGLSPSESAVISAVYFFGSFAFLIGRTCAVTLFAARIHDNSKNALPYLYNCSASNYGIEAQRLQYQLATDDAVLTGLRFFSITRNFMLAVTGAIVTYEVVLLQFNANSNK
ncbi:gustatory receptor for sugar taste 64f isoform X2 [Andrena cerasifolii]|uniref:gustatory receptor for sugar taste 64f isoform X2 n=1 Tax=Andrena cerasifolii TaxID=2819439 RepID=UPI0040377134